MSPEGDDHYFFQTVNSNPNPLGGEVSFHMKPFSEFIYILYF